MEKITEELFTSIIKRLEIVEEKLNNTGNTSHTNHTGNTKGMASQKQIDFIVGLGGDAWEGMTSKEASEVIEDLKNKKAKEKIKPVHIDLEINRLAHGKLTQEEIEQLGEDAFI